MERGGDLLQLSRQPNEAENTLEALITRYGDENGRYLFEEFQRYRAHYSRLVYIDTGVGAGHGFENCARDEATRKGWQFEITAGTWHGLRNCCTAIGTTTSSCCAPASAA